MNVDQLKNIEDIIPLLSGKKITGHKVSRLTAPGDNYGSLMLKVDVSIQTPEGNEELNTVVKMVPPNELIQRIFNTQVTFRNEIGYYKIIIPLLQEFQKERGVEEVIDFTPKFYGGRLNLRNDESRVEADGALVLENLKVKGFTTLERTEGLNFNAAKMVLKELAKFHAVPLAFRLQKPELFEEKIKPFLFPLKINGEDFEKIRNSQLVIFEVIPEILPLKKRILAKFDRIKENYKPRELFATIVHNDLWTNNVMFQIKGSETLKTKIIDFQGLDYGSPAKDVVFFIFSSIKSEVVQHKYEELIRLYYHTFVGILKELGCDEGPYGYEVFLNEIEFEATTSQFGRLMFMTVPIWENREVTVEELSEFTTESFNSRYERLDERQKKRFLFLFDEFAKRNWI